MIATTPAPVEVTALKPCPFCGAKPHQGLTKVTYCQLHGDPIQRFEIKCPHGCATINRVNRAQAIAAWNARPVQADLVEALASAIASIEDDRGLDDAICCSGHMCGCQAATHRQLILHDLRATLTRATGDGA